MMFGFLDVFRNSPPVPAATNASTSVATADSLRPVLTITLPALWLFLLISPGMKRWIRQT
jgi:hypothetical protein